MAARVNGFCGNLKYYAAGIGAPIVAGAAFGPPGALTCIALEVSALALRSCFNRPRRLENPEPAQPERLQQQAQQPEALQAGGREANDDGQLALAMQLSLDDQALPPAAPIAASREAADLEAALAASLADHQRIDLAAGADPIDERQRLASLRENIARINPYELRFLAEVRQEDNCVFPSGEMSPNKHLFLIALLLNQPTPVNGEMPQFLTENFGLNIPTIQKIKLVSLNQKMKSEEKFIEIENHLKPLDRRRFWTYVRALKEEGILSDVTINCDAKIRQAIEADQRHDEAVLVEEPQLLPLAKPLAEKKDYKGGPASPPLKTPSAEERRRAALDAIRRRQTGKGTAKVDLEAE